MRLFTFVVIILFSLNVSAQQILGGNSVYDFVNLPQSSRIAALGGMNQAISDADVSMMFQNPALLNAAMDNHLHLDNSFYLGGTNEMLAGYVKDFKNFGIVGFGVQYMNYGTVQTTDVYGNTLGQTTPRDLVLNAEIARPINSVFYYGLNVKYLSSHYDTYTSTALLADVGFSARDTAHGLTASVVMKNFGTQLSYYVPGQSEPVPFDVQAGVSERLSHTPFLFSLTLHDLTTYDIRYNDPALTPVNTLISDTGQTQKTKKYTADKILRHCVFGAEIFLGKVLRIDLGYNDERRQELAFPDRPALSGFNFGAALTLKKWGISYGYSYYNTTASANTISLYLKIDEWIPGLKKKGNG